MTPSEAKRLKAGDVVASDSSVCFARRCVVTKVEVLTSAKVNVYIEGLATNPRREHRVFAVTEAHKVYWDRLQEERAQREVLAAEIAAVEAFFGVRPLTHCNSLAHTPSEDYTVTLNRAEVKALMARLEAQHV